MKNVPHVVRHTRTLKKTSKHPGKSKGKIQVKAGQKHLQRVVDKAVRRALWQVQPPNPNVSTVLQADNASRLLAANEKKSVQQLRVALLFLLADDEWETEQFLTEQIRLLAHDILQCKRAVDVQSCLPVFQPDFLLVVGGCSSRISDEEREALANLRLPKLIWLNDGGMTNEAARELACCCDRVFTQNPSYVPYYLHGGCRSVQVLPFPANPDIYFPIFTGKAYYSDLLVIGDATPERVQILKGSLSQLEGSKVLGTGVGWEQECPQVLPISSDQLHRYYNGANIVLHFGVGQRPQRLFEIAACGAFQLAEDHPVIYPFLNPGKDIATFHTPEEFNTQLVYYLNNPEFKRKMATVALEGSKYHFSAGRFITRMLYEFINLQEEEGQKY